jgi:hypothetical protein
VANERLAIEITANGSKAVSEFKKVGKAADGSFKDIGKSATGATEKAGTAAATGFKSKFSAGLSAAGGMGLEKFLAAGAIAGAVKFAINAASSLQESLSKSKAVFRENATEVEAWAKTASKSFGQSQASALEAAGTFGNLFQAFGIGLEPATEMSMTLTELASDLASFNNTSVQEAIEALRSGLSGETEPLKRYGVALTDARLKQEALGLGLISDVKKPLDAAAKSQAAYSLIMKDTALAQGDFDRTADGYANTMRTLKATVEDAAAALGTQLLPALSDLAQVATKGIEILVNIKTVEEDKGGLGGFIDKALAEVTQSTGAIIKDFWAHATTGTAPWEDVNKYKDAIQQTTVTPSMLGYINIQTRSLELVHQSIGVTAGMVAAKGREQQAAINAAAAIERESVAFQGLLNAQLAAFDSTFAVTDATNRFTTAAFAANTATDDNTTAIDEQQVAYDEAARAALGTAAATVQFASDQKTLEGGTLSAKEATKIQIDTLTTLANKIGGPVATQIMDMVGKLQTLDKTNADPDATLNDQATAKILAVRASLANLNGLSATVAIDALFRGGAAMSEANRFLSIARQAQSAANSLPRKTGGPIPGPVNKPVPVLAHGGEYVLSADVVDRIKRGDTSRGASASLSLPTGGGGGGATVVNFNGTFLTSKAELGRMVDEALAESRRRGNRAA